MSAIHNLEKYFAKNYTAKYCELEGGLYNGENSTPMLKYFKSGTYKELEDRELTKLYNKVKKQAFIRNGIFMFVILWVIVSIF